MKNLKKTTLSAIIVLVFSVVLALPGAASADSLITNVNVGTLPFDLAINETTNKIYVVNRNSDSVSVIDGVTNTVIKTISVGTTPTKITVNPATNRIYVANTFGDSVSVINGATDTVLTTVATGSYPYAIDVNMVTNKIYVPNNGSDNVTIIDGVTSGTTTVAVGAQPTSIVVNDVTNKIYVNNETDGSISVIDGVTGTVAKTIASAGASNISLNKTSNKLYTTTPINNIVKKINGATDTYTGDLAIPGGINIEKPSFNEASNRIYFPDWGANKLFIVDGATDSYLTQIDTGAGSKPRFSAYNSVTNKIYVSTTSTNLLKVYNGTSYAPISSLAAGTYAANIGINKTTSKIYVCNWNSNNVSIYDGSVATPVPAITSLSPNSGNIGATIDINGSNFGAVQGTSVVKFYNNVTATSISLWSDTKITVQVPVGTTTGNITVTTTGGTSNGVNFTVTVPPAITSLSPNSGNIGATIDINGSNFGAIQGTSTVKFYNNVTATTITLWSNTKITVQVPVGATTGNVTVTTISGTSNGVNFMVISSGTGPILNLAGGVSFMAGDKNSNKIYALMDINTFKFAIIDHVAGTITYKNVTGFSAKDKAGWHFSINPVTGKIYLPYSTSTPYSNGMMKKDIAIIDPVTFSVTKKIIISSGADIHKIIVDETSNRIFILDILGKITVISGSTDKVLKTVATSAGSSYIADDFEYDSVRNKIYTVGYTGTKRYLIVVSAATYKKTKTIILFGNLNPGGRVFLDTTNVKVYVSFPTAGTINGSVSIYNGITDSIAKTITLTGPFSDLSINSANGKTYILSPYKIKIISAATLTDISTIDLVDRAFFMAANPQTNKIYVFQDSAAAPIHDGTAYQLQVFDASGGAIDTISFPYPVSSGSYDQCSPILVFGSKTYLPGSVAWQYQSASPAPAYLVVSD